MKVLVIHNFYQSRYIGGEDLVVVREIAGLKAQLGAENVFEYRVSNDRLNAVKLALTIWGNRTHYDNIKSLVTQHKIDIVHVHNFFPLLTPLAFVAAKQAGAKVVHTLHNFRWWCPSGVLYRKEAGVCEKCVAKSFAYPAVLHQCYRGSSVQSLAASMAFSWYRLRKYQRSIDGYFALSQFQQEKLSSFGLKDRVWLKPNPIDLPTTQIPPKQKQHYLYVGRLEAAKGVELLLSTWKQLPSDFHLDVIGEGDEKAALERQYAQPNIRFLGKVSHHEVLQRSQAAKYFLHTSLAYETFGLTLVEALAHGTPIIALNIGTRNQFIQSGKNGFLCEEQGLKEILLRSKDHPDYEAMSYQAIESVQAYALPTVISQQVQLYDKIASNV